MRQIEPRRWRKETEKQQGVRRKTKRVKRRDGFDKERVMHYVRCC